MYLSKSFLNKKIINISIEFNVFFFINTNFLSCSIYGALSGNLNLIFEFAINLNFMLAIFQKTLGQFKI